MRFAPGDTFDRYRLEAVIGEGGMGRVFRAFDPKLRRPVAIKILQPHRFANGADRVARVMREAQAAAALNHPGAVATFDVSEADGHPFIVMEFVAGQPLRALIGVEQISMTERLRWMIDVARVLAAAHRVGLVHRDIKPENVMIREDGVVKLLDFGIARRLDPDDSLGLLAPPGVLANRAESSMAGTPYYMAPEQVQRQPVDARADQFAWAVMAYELFTGILPWQTLNDNVSMAIAVVTERQETLNTRALGLPDHVATVVDRALEKSPARRFESMETLLDALCVDAPEALPNLPTLAPKIDLRTIPDTQEGTHTAIDIDSRSGLDRPKLARPVARRWAMLLAISCVFAAAGWVLLRTTSSNEAPPAVATKSEVISKPSDVPIEAWQPSALAREAYEQGLLHMKNAALEAAIEDFESAVEFEPKYAAAYLRIALLRFIDGPHPAGSEPFLVATRLRSRLDHRERALLDAFAPAFAKEPPGLEETVQNLMGVEHRFPNDPEVDLYRPMILTMTGRDDEGAAGFRVYLERHPNNATPWLAFAYIHGRRDEFDDAFHAITKCLEQSPEALDCLWFRGKLEAHTGRCEDMAATALRHNELDEIPDHEGSYIRALIAQRRDPATIDKAIADATASLRITARTRIERQFAAARLALAGKFVEADQHLAALPNETQLYNEVYLWVQEFRVALHEEMGDTSGAASLANDMVLRKKSLPGAGDVHFEGVSDDPTMVFHGLLHATGAIDRNELQMRRQTWLETWRARGIQNERELWGRAFGGSARTPEMAREALTILDPLGPPRRFVADRLLVVDSAQVLLLAGRTDLAITLLEEATTSCLAAIEPLRFVQAFAWLGRAHEAKGNVEAACQAYSTVLSYWGAARPSSITAQDAERRARGLGCKRARGSAK